jgi:hypothetical protein
VLRVISTYLPLSYSTTLIGFITYTPSVDGLCHGLWGLWIREHHLSRAGQVQQGRPCRIHIFLEGLGPRVLQLHQLLPDKSLHQLPLSQDTRFTSWIEQGTNVHSFPF